MQSDELDIYRRGDRIRNKVEQIRADPKLTKRNRELILEFHRSVIARGLGTERQHKYLQSLQSVGHWLGKDFNKATQKDITRVLVDHVENNGYAEWTKTNYRQVIKKFYKWLEGGKFASLVVDIKATEPKEHTQRRWVLLTEEDVTKIIEVTDHPRDAALFAMLWESGARISEVMGVQIRHLELFDDGSIRVSFEGKTGVRAVKLWMAAPYIRDWLRQHPDRKNSSATLWPSREQIDRGVPISYTIVTKLIKRYSERAKIEGKDVNPHAWRHARATYLANKGWSEQQLNKYLGWIFGSKMPRVYIDRAGVDTDSAVDSLYGILPKEKELPKDKPQRCIRCRELVAVTSTFCAKCGMPMTQEAAVLEKESKETAQEILMRRLEKLEAMVKAKR